MNVVSIWKVPAKSTRIFMEKMKEKGLRQDSYATILNRLFGFNYWYETTESFGDVSEFAANSLSKNLMLNIKSF